MTTSMLTTQLRHNGLVYAFLTAFGIALLGCKEETPTPSNIEEYYVKYEAFGSTIYSGRSLHVVLKDESGSSKILAIPARSKWEYTIGPVRKGFESNLRVSEIEPNYGQLKLSAQVSVSKNGSPFAVKMMNASSVPTTSTGVSYTIDY